MKLTIKYGRLYDVHAREFVEALVDWIGHGDHDKTPVKKTKKMYIFLATILTILIFLLYWTIWRPYTFYRFYKNLPNTKAEFVPIVSTFGRSKAYV